MKDVIIEFVEMETKDTGLMIVRFHGKLKPADAEVFRKELEVLCAEFELAEG